MRTSLISSDAVDLDSTPRDGIDSSPRGGIDSAPGVELIPPLGDGKVIDSSSASVHKEPNSECLRPKIPGLEKLRNGVSMQE